MIRTGARETLMMDQEDILRTTIPVGRSFRMTGVSLDSLTLLVEESNAGDVRCYDCWFNEKCGSSWFKLPKCSKWRRSDECDVVFKEIKSK